MQKRVSDTPAARLAGAAGAKIRTVLSPARDRQRQPAAAGTGAARAAGTSGAEPARSESGRQSRARRRAVDTYISARHERRSEKQREREREQRVVAAVRGPRARGWITLAAPVAESRVALSVCVPRVLAIFCDSWDIRMYSGRTTSEWIKCSEVNAGDLTQCTVFLFFAQQCFSHRRISLYCLVHGEDSFTAAIYRLCMCVVLSRRRNDRGWRWRCCRCSGGPPAREELRLSCIPPCAKLIYLKTRRLVWWWEKYGDSKVTGGELFCRECARVWEKGGRGVVSYCVSCTSDEGYQKKCLRGSSSRLTSSCNARLFCVSLRCTCFIS